MAQAENGSNAPNANLSGFLWLHVIPGPRDTLDRHDPSSQIVVYQKIDATSPAGAQDRALVSLVTSMSECMGGGKEAAIHEALCKMERLFDGMGVQDPFHDVRAR